MHDLMFLAVGHLEPVQALFPTAQTAFAIAFGIGFANADAGAGDGEKIGLFHILKAFKTRDRTNQNFRLLSLPPKHDRCIQQGSYQYSIELIILYPNYCNGIVSIQIGGAKCTVRSPRSITVCLAESCFNTNLEFLYILIFRRPYAQLQLFALYDLISLRKD